MVETLLAKEDLKVANEILPVCLTKSPTPPSLRRREVQEELHLRERERNDTSP